MMSVVIGRNGVEFPRPFASYSTDKIYGTICVSPQDKILLVLGRLSMLWSLPKGHRKSQESSFQCAVRELHEETGICIDQTHLNFSELPYKRLKIGRYYLLEFPEEVQPCPHDRNEIVSAKWFSLSEIYSLIENKQANIDVRRLGSILDTTF